MGAFELDAGCRPCKIRLANREPSQLQLDKLVGLSMLVVASVVFLYYSVWTLLMVRPTLLVFVLLL